MQCVRSPPKAHRSAKVTPVLSFDRLLNQVAHPDLEVFRLRLGKALDFDYYEDWQGSLFSRAEPRTGGPALDVERVMNKLQKVALRYAKKHGRPLVIVFNSKLRPRQALRQRQLKSVDVHLFTNTPEGHALLHQLQQRAETWAQRVSTGHNGMCETLATGV